MNQVKNTVSMKTPLIDIYAETTGTLMMNMKRAGIRDVEKIAKEMEALKHLQLAAGIFSFDAFSTSGSDALTPMATSPDSAPRPCSVWSTNLYLGLNRDDRVIESVVSAIREFGTGSGTSAVSGGMSVLHKKIEAKIARWLGKESVMLFPTGYSANMGVLAALCAEDDHIIIDEESHASIRDGIKLSPARRWISFAHNSVKDLEDKLRQAQQTCRGKIVVIVESAYSMSGDICPLAELVRLKVKYKFLIFVDEAHSFGIYGPGGKGLCCQEGITEKVDFITSTFSKATASIGGFVAMSGNYSSYFQWSANAYAFQACFTPGDAAAILAALEIIESDAGIRRALHEKKDYMRSRLIAAGFDLRRSETPVIPVYISETEKLLKVCFDLYKQGIFSVPVAYPMVAESDGRIRFIVNVRHTYEQIDNLVSTLTQVACDNDLLLSRGGN